jgi:hypothetical protein
MMVVSVWSNEEKKHFHVKCSLKKETILVWRVE